jgi:hypothetical protein
VNAPMAGKFVRRDGPGKTHNESMQDARDCHCCGQPPGKWRVIARRAAKRGDKGKFRQSIRKYLNR